MPWPNNTIMPEADKAFFSEQGDRAYWYSGSLCSCGTNPGSPSDRARSVTTCKACGGLGVVYPLPPVYIRGIVSHAMQDRTLLETGMSISADDLVWSSDPWGEGPISPYDLLVLVGDPHTWPFEGQVLTRGFGSADALWYTAGALVSVTSSDPSTGIITAYTGATISGKNVDWSASANPPAAGAQYSVTYRAQYEWVCFLPPMVRYENTQSLGQKAVLRKRHIVANSALVASTFLQA